MRPFRGGFRCRCGLSLKYSRSGHRPNSSYKRCLQAALRCFLFAA
jgi:hypothetical protein